MEGKSKEFLIKSKLFHETFQEKAQRENKILTEFSKQWNGRKILQSKNRNQAWRDEGDAERVELRKKG